MTSKCKLIANYIYVGPSVGCTTLCMGGWGCVLRPSEPEVVAATPPIQLTCAHCYKGNDLREYGLSEQMTERRKWGMPSHLQWVTDIRILASAVWLRPLPSQSLLRAYCWSFCSIVPSSGICSHGNSQSSAICQCCIIIYHEKWDTFLLNRTVHWPLVNFPGGV